MRAVVLVPLRAEERRARPANGKRLPASAAPPRSPEDRLEEAVGLARAIDLEVRVAEIVPLARPQAATLIGSGKVAELAALVAEHEAGLAIVDHPLSAIQQRNLEKAWNCKVLDRTGLILEIFGERALTREGRLQVELAHLNYQKSRLVRSWTHLERQRRQVDAVQPPHRRLRHRQGPGVRDARPHHARGEADERAAHHPLRHGG